MPRNDRMLVGCELMYPGSCRQYVEKLDADGLLADVIEAVAAAPAGDASGDRVPHVVDWLEKHDRWSEEHNELLQSLTVAHLELSVRRLAQVIDRSDVRR